MPGDVIKINGNLMEAFDLSYASLWQESDGSVKPESLKALEELLNDGFEPFAVTQIVRMPAQNSLVSGAQPRPIVGDKVWLRKKSLVSTTKKDSPQLA